MPEKEPLLTQDQQTFRLYPKRWVVLALFCCLSCSNNIQWIIFSPVVHEVRVYFHTTSTAINWMPLIYNIIYVIGVFPVCSVYEELGLRNGMLVGAVINAIGAVGKVIAVYACPELWVLILTQLFSGAGQLFVLGLPAMVASIWFSDKERTLATSFAVNASNLGIALGFLLSPACVKSPTKEDMGLLFGHQAAICVLVLILVFFFVDRKPPTPPSISANVQAEAVRILPVLKELLRNRSFVILCIAVGVGQSVFGGVAAVLTQVLYPYNVSEDSAGWVGFIGVLTGIVACFVLGFVIDRIRVYRIPLTLALFFATITQILFVLFLMYHVGSPVVNSFVWVGLTQTLQALTYPLCFEFVAEITHPAPESLSGGAIMLVNNALTFAITLTMSQLLGNTPSQAEAREVMWLGVAATFLSAGLCFIVKEDRRRFALELKNSPSLPLPQETKSAHSVSLQTYNDGME